MRTTVGDVMTSPVETVEPDAGFKEIVERLRARRISAVPVVDATGRALGIVSEADLLLKEDRAEVEGRQRFLEGRRSRRERVRAAAGTAAELMTSPAATIGADAPVAEAARAMRRRGVKRLAVVDEAGRVVGIVSRGDLLAVFTRSDDEIRDEIADEVIVGTLLLDPGPFEVQVREGVVTLRGEADRRTDAVLVARLAARVDGVVNVRSELIYRVDDGELAPARRRVGSDG
ncbi:MAG TPA: CBS domain-containing protein [Candidatus Dormibacteraeota bacterium]|nr:CBS domain-containing protein [Candidatus Dormibacteraeota bacterium]